MVTWSELKIKTTLRVLEKKGVSLKGCGSLMLIIAIDNLISMIIVMIRRKLISRRREKDRESLRYNRGDEDDWMKVEDEEEVIEDKYIKHCH